MEVINSEQFGEANIAIGLIYNFLKANYSWYSTNDSNYILYVTQNIYLKLGYNNSMICIDFKDENNWSAVRSCYTDDGNSTHKVSIYKVNDDCIGIGISAGSSTIGYTKKCFLFIDTYTVNGDKHKMVVVRHDDTNLYIADGYTPNTAIYSVYTSASYDGEPTASYNTYWPSSQIIPFVSPYSGYKADNLQAVVLTSKTNEFVTLNDNLWLFTNTFALPCDNIVTYA